jgi:hypothetical protein
VIKNDQKPAKNSKKQQKTTRFRLAQLNMAARHPLWR